MLRFFSKCHRNQKGEGEGSLIFLIIGVWLFLAERDLIEYELLIKLLLPVILILIIGYYLYILYMLRNHFVDY